VDEYSKVKNPFGSNGRVQQGQLKRAEDILASTALEGYLKVVLIHHHFYRPLVSYEGTLQGVWRTIEAETLKLRGKRKLVRVFIRNNVRIVLHGHIHESADYELDGIRFLNGGGSVIGQDPQTLSINYLHCGRAGVRVESDSIPRQDQKPPPNQLELLSSDAA
jgi:3',5'-cyclic AMP phosphodiesterase CpdA